MVKQIAYPIIALTAFLTAHNSFCNEQANANARLANNRRYLYELRSIIETTGKVLKKLEKRDATSSLEYLGNHATYLNAQNDEKRIHQEIAFDKRIIRFFTQNKN